MDDPIRKRDGVIDPPNLRSDHQCLMTQFELATRQIGNHHLDPANPGEKGGSEMTNSHGGMLPRGDRAFQWHVSTLEH